MYKKEQMKIIKQKNKAAETESSLEGSSSTVALERTLESPLDCKEIQPVHPKRNQPGIFIGRTDAETETLILWSPDSLKKTLMLGMIEGRRRRGDRG